MGLMEWGCCVGDEWDWDRGPTSIAEQEEDTGAPQFDRPQCEAAADYLMPLRRGTSPREMPRQCGLFLGAAGVTEFLQNDSLLDGGQPASWVGAERVIVKSTEPSVTR